MCSVRVLNCPKILKFRLTDVRIKIIGNSRKFLLKPGNAKIYFELKNYGYLIRLNYRSTEIAEVQKFVEVDKK